MDFNSPNLFLNGVGVAGRLREEDVKVRMYLCQVRRNPGVYRELAEKNRERHRGLTDSKK